MSVALTVLLALATPVATHAARSFTESFTSTTYKDAANTTADWNTASGQLKLFPFVPSETGSYDTPGNARGIVIAGNVALVADGAAGLQILDITNPASPTLIGTYNTPGIAYDVAVSGTLAYVADHLSGLQIIDITNPAAPVLVGTYNTPGEARGVAVSGTLAFVADYLSGLQIINIATPATPTLKGSYNTPGESWSVAVDGDYAFVADGTFGLQIIDITNTAAPTLAGNYNTPQVAMGVAVSGDIALVGDGTGGLRVINITNPTLPTSSGTYDTPGTATAVRMAGDRAYVADGTFGLQVIDITNPASPVLKATFDTPGTAIGVALDGEHVLVGDDVSGVRVVRAGQRAAPAHIGAALSVPSSFCLTVAGDLAFVGRDGGLDIVSIANPAAPVLVNTFPLASLAGHVEVAGNFAFVAAGDGLKIINIANPASPALTGSLNSASNRGVSVQGDLAYVAHGTGLAIVDVSSPTTPIPLGQWTGPIPEALSVVVSGSLAVVGLATGKVSIFDVANPYSSPVLLSEVDTGTWPTADIHVSGRYVYAACDRDGLKIIDMANPASPTLTATYDTPGAVEGICVSGDLAVIADYFDGLLVIDISNPSAPTLAGAYSGLGASRHVRLAGNVAFVAEESGSSGGLHAIQVMQDDVDETRNTARSLPVDGGTSAISRVRLSTTQAAGVSWEVSANNGTNWQSITPDNAWTALTTPGSDLVWRSTHRWVAPGVNPSVSDLRLEWLYEHPVIDAITDIPNDQGRHVKIRFAASGYDGTGPFPSILSYEAYRRNPAAAASLEPAGKSPAQLLAGGWTQVGTVAAHEEAGYGIDVPTIADSTITHGQYFSAFYIRAATSAPGSFFDSPSDSGYSLDNLSPGVPSSFVYTAGALGWIAPKDADVDHYTVYGATGRCFCNATVIDETKQPGLDVSASPYPYYFVTATDASGNESKPATIGANAGGTLKQYTLSVSSYPNPFNPETTVRYTVPSKGKVTVEIFDARGARVRTLVSGNKDAGAYTQPWAGQDNAGQAVSSGVYFARITHATGTKTYKMVLLK